MPRARGARRDGSLLQSAAVPTGWLAARPAPWRAAIDAVTLDPAPVTPAGRRRAAARRVGGGSLPCRASGQRRRRRGAPPECCRRLLGIGPQGRPALSAPRQLLVAHERLTERGWARIQTGLNVGDPGRRGRRRLYRQGAAPRGLATPSQRRARRRLERFYAHCRTADVVELRRLATTVRRWEPEIFGWQRTRLSNGPTEAMTC
jgi:hypothetical protein